jgi:chromosome segregation ATPase
LNEANISVRAEVEGYKKENKQLEKKYQNSISLQRAGTALDTTMRLNSSRSSAAADTMSLASGKSSSSTAGGNSHSVLKQELRNTKEKLSKTEKKVSAIAAERDELATRIKLLEDALDQHVEEMGLSGQADLLAKIAALRGEVLALQDDLARSKGMLSEAEKCREVIAQDKNYLEEQIESIYQRLSTTQEENARIKATSVQEYLEQVERERNLLLDYVHQDMEKSSVIEKEKDELLVSLKESKQREKEIKKAFEELEFEVRQNAYSKVVGASALDAKQKDLQENIDCVERELELTKHALSRKEAEADELSKMQMELLGKMKEKEITYQKVCLDLKSIKKSIKDAANFQQGSTDSSETEVGVLMTTVHIEMQSLRHQIDSKDSELRSLKQQVDAKNREIVELRTQSTVDEAVAIVEDRNRLSKEVDELRSDLAYFKTLELTLADLNEVLLSKLRSNEIKSSGSSTIISKFNKSASLSPTKSNISSPGGSIYRREVAASSQEHAVWTMLPQIRQLCLPLYECIQKLFQDFHTKELETVELLATVDSLQRNVSGLTQRLADEIEDHREEKQKFVKLKDDMNVEIEKLEVESSRGKAAQAILDQVKYILQSLPGSVFGNIDNSFQKPTESFQSADDSFELPSVSGSHFRPSDSRGFSSFVEVSVYIIFM